MKRIVTNYRYYILAILSLVAMLGIFAIPDDNQSMGSWLIGLIASKAIGIGCAYTVYRLAKYWESRNEISEFSNL